MAPTVGVHPNLPTQLISKEIVVRLYNDGTQTPRCAQSRDLL